MIPAYTRVKIKGNTLGGSSEWVGFRGIIDDEDKTTYRIKFFSEDGKLRGQAMFFRKAFDLEEPIAGDLVLVPAVYKGRILSTPDCKVQSIDGHVEMKLPVRMVVPMQLPKTKPEKEGKRG